MAVSATVTAGKIFQDGESVTISELNKLGTPTVDISGSVGTLSLTDGSVTNAKVASAAGIQLDKLQSGSSAQVIVANSSGVPTYVALSGDATISDAGALTLAADSVVTADITDANVTTAKIADDAVTADKLANTSVTAGSYTLASVTVDAQGRLTAASNGSVELQTPRVQAFTGDGTWTAPTGVTRAKFTIVGGGGAGSAGNEGGGSGATVIASVAVTASTGYSVTVGSGAATSAASGGTSSVVVGSTTYSAGGGASGGTGSGAGGTAGANGDVKLNGVQGRATQGENYAPAPLISHYGTGGSAPTTGTGAQAGADGIVIVEWLE